MGNNDTIALMADLFDLADFESLEITLYFQNLTTDKIVEDITKVTIIEVGEKHFILGLPAWACDIGAHILLKIYKVEKPSREETPLFNTTAKVDEVQAADQNQGQSMIMARLDLLQFDKKSLKDFLALFSKRQEEISQYLAAGKR